jgi:3-dehydroquinate dehydratase type I
MGEIPLGRWRLRTPAVCASVVAGTCSEMRSLAESAGSRGAQIVELRLDALRSEPDWDELSRISLPTILTVRSRREGGVFRGSEEERVSLILEGISRIRPCVDIEFSTGKAHLSRIIEAARQEECAVILSHHDLKGTPMPATLLKTAKRMEEFPSDVLKIVTMCRNWRDVERIMNFALEGRWELSKPLISFGMGEAGLMTRFLSLVLGSPIIYAAAGRRAAPGQPDLDFAVSVLRETPAWEVEG